MSSSEDQSLSLEEEAVETCCVSRSDDMSDNSGGLELKQNSSGENVCKILGDDNKSAISHDDCGVADGRKENSPSSVDLGTTPRDVSSESMDG